MFRTTIFSKPICLIILFLSLRTYAKNEIDPRSFIQDIEVLSPAPLSDVEGKVKVKVKAKRMTNLRARYLKDLTPKGIRLNKEGEGSFVLDARKLPQGPINLQILGTNEKGEQDIFELQLYNTSKKALNEGGIPDTIPTPAQGMELAFSDDFNKMPTISRDGRGARYNAHKPRFGDFSGWPFSDPTNDENGPFNQRDTYLIIQARKAPGTKGQTGLLATVDMDGNGFWAKAPFYMECRMIAHSAPGTWPAFWTVTNIDKGAGDELDVIEAYGGWGEGNPNSVDYWTTTHYWGQKDEEGKDKKAPYKLVDMRKSGKKTSWSEEFHTYGLYVDKEWTIYYLDNEEVLRHVSNSYSYEAAHVQMINYAIGGASGWKIDLERYGNKSNMYVDFIRVFMGK